jgi:hypothetical protein
MKLCFKSLDKATPYQDHQPEVGNPKLEIQPCVDHPANWNLEM